MKFSKPTQKQLFMIFMGKTLAVILLAAFVCTTAQEYLLNTKSTILNIVGIVSIVAVLMGVLSIIYDFIKNINIKL